MAEPPAGDHPLRVVRLCAWLGLVAGLGGCGDNTDADRTSPGPRPGAQIVSLGIPVPPRPVRTPAPATVELRAPGPRQRGGATWRAFVLTPPPDRARDACVGAGLDQQDLLEADVSCDVLSGASAASFVEVVGVPDRYGPAPTLVIGVAPRGVRSVRLEGPGGERRLPLSRHRAFLALYAADARGPVRLTSESAAGRTTRSFALPLSRREQSAHHEHRRRGAVFNDEVGENITSSSYGQIIRRFGPPTAVRRRGTERCAYYEVVGYPRDGWRFCFAGDGHMTGASGGTPPPGR